MSAAPIASLADAWAAMEAQARQSLAEAEAGQLRASSRQQARWRQVVANDELLRAQS